MTRNPHETDTRPALAAFCEWNAAFDELDALLAREDVVQAVEAKDEAEMDRLGYTFAMDWIRQAVLAVAAAVPTSLAGAHGKVEFEMSAGIDTEGLNLRTLHRGLADMGHA